MTRTARIYVTCVVALAIAAFALGSWAGGLPTNDQTAMIAGFAVALIVVQLLPVPFPRGSQVELIRVEEALVVPLVLMLEPAAALVAVAAGVLAGQLLSGRPDPIKVTFNAAQMVVSVGAALAVTWLVAGGPAPGFGLLPVVGAAGGLVAMFVVNQLLVAGVMRAAAGTPFTRVLLDDVAVKAGMWVTNAAIGLLLAVPAIEAPWLLLVALVPLVMLHGAWRIHGEHAREERRLSELGTAVGGFSGGIAIERVARALVESAREVVGASCVRVHLYEPDRQFWVRLTPRGIEFTEGGRVQPPLQAAERETFNVELAGSHGVLGELRMWHDSDVDGGTPELTRRDRTLLEMLASHAAAALDNSQLNARSVMQQRTIKQVFDHSSEGLLVLDRHGRVRGWNPAMHAMSGFAEPTVTASPISLISPQLANIPNEAGPGMVEAIISTADGEHRHVRASYAPIDDEVAGADGEVVSGRSWVVVVHDSTAEQETERLKDDFVATVSHELRTPLTAIKGFLETMRRDDIELGEAQVRMFLQIMGDQADRLERLIGDLLDMSAIESGRPLEVELAPVDASIAIRNAILAFESARPTAKVTFEQPATGLVVRADPHRLEQVISNLLDNAFKHGGMDEPIEVSLTHEDDGSATVAIRDHGPGISMADQRRIFERFFVTSNSVTRTGGGAGLGLYICRRLVDAMTGTISVQSTVGEGTTFSVSLLVLASSMPSEERPSTAALSLDEARDLLDADPT